MTEVEENFRYIVRIANTDIDGNRKVVYALTGIKGIGIRVAEGIVRQLGVDPHEKIGALGDERIEELRRIIEEELSEVLPEWMVNQRKEFYTGEPLHFISTEHDLKVQENINRMKRMRCYRGIRHERGLPVRGQRTRSNGRRGLALGVSRKKS
jgi:small subunit ribosomal protein S13